MIQSRGGRTNQPLLTPPLGKLLRRGHEKGQHHSHQRGALDKGGGPYSEWIEAIRTGVPALSNFAQSGPFSETVLLGNVAIRAGKKILWDAKSLAATNAPEVAPLIRRAYRKGWELA